MRSFQNEVQCDVAFQELKEFIVDSQKSLNKYKSKPTFNKEWANKRQSDILRYLEALDILKAIVKDLTMKLKSIYSEGYQKGNLDTEKKQAIKYWYGKHNPNSKKDKEIIRDLSIQRAYTLDNI